MKKPRKFTYIPEKEKSVIENILDKVHLHDHTYNNWTSDICSHINWYFEHAAEKDPDQFFPPLEEKFLSVKNKALYEGLLLGLWDGAASVCWNHEGNAACTDEDWNAEEERIFNSAKKYYDRYYFKCLDVLENGVGFEFNGESFRIKASLGNIHDENAVVITAEYTVNGKCRQHSGAVTEEDLMELCLWENAELENVEEYCYTLTDENNENNKIFSFKAEKKPDGVDVTVIFGDCTEEYRFKRHMKFIEYIQFLNFFSFIHIVLFDSRRCWL